MTAALLVLPIAPPTTCECPAEVHRPARMFGPSSRFRDAGTAGHAARARLRATQTWEQPVPRGPRVCSTCVDAGHHHGATS